MAMLGSSSISPDTPLGPPPPGQVSDFSHPRDDNHYYFFAVSLGLLFGVSTLCVLARVYVRMALTKRFGWDDAMAVLSMGMNIGATICWVEEMGLGLVWDDWNVRKLDYLKNSFYPDFHWGVTATLFITFLNPAVKISMLILYLRIVEGTHRKFRIYIYVLIVCLFGSFLGFTINLLTWCKPVQKVFWYNVPGKCNISTHFIFGQAMVSMVADFLILIPPIPVIWKLPTTRLRRMGLIFILCFGFVVTAVAFARAVIVFPGFLPNDALYDQFYFIYTIVLEVNLSIIVVCLPALAKLVLQFSHNRNANRPAQNSPGAENVALDKRSDPQSPRNVGHGDNQKEAEDSSSQGPSVDTQSAESRYGHATQAPTDNGL